MTETEFRVMHSKIIGYYQLIEMRLKSICAGLLADEERDWFDRLYDFESDPFGLLIRKTMEIQVKKQVTLLTQDDFTALDDLRKTRNYWVHQCFGGSAPIVFSNKGEVKRSIYAKKIILDLDNAVAWDKKLTKIINCLHF